MYGTPQSAPELLVGSMTSQMRHTLRQGGQALSPAAAAAAVLQHVASPTAGSAVQFPDPQPLGAVASKCAVC